MQNLYPNPELQLSNPNRPQWALAQNRRAAYHHLLRTARYSSSFRAAHIMPLQPNTDERIGQREDVRMHTALPAFSAMVVVRGNDVLFEKYAPDFAPDQAHAIMSITKTMVSLIIGKLVAEGRIDLSQTIDHYLPDIGSGYAKATVQQVLDMRVANDYVEGFDANHVSLLDLLQSAGLALSANGCEDPSARQCLSRIHSDDSASPTPLLDYNSANPVLLGWLAERVSGRPLRDFIADIADAAGVEHALNVATDRWGVPAVGGGASMSARDLARYGSVWARRGLGVNGQRVGDAAFIETTRRRGVPYETDSDYWYSNFTDTHRSGRSIGHGGGGGQYLHVDMETGTVGVFFSVIENESGMPSDDYYGQLVSMFEGIAGFMC